MPMVLRVYSGSHCSGTTWCGIQLSTQAGQEPIELSFWSLLLFSSICPTFICISTVSINLMKRIVNYKLYIHVL